MCFNSVFLSDTKNNVLKDAISFNHQDSDLGTVKVDLEIEVIVL